MKGNPVRFIQLSDTHIFANAQQELLGVKTQNSFTAILNLIQQENLSPDFYLISGDLSQDGSAESYTFLAEQLMQLERPVYVVPGNHDDAKMMEKVFPLHTVSGIKHIVLKNWHFILLESQQTGKVEGFLQPAQLRYLEFCLQAYPEHYAGIVFHHHPLPVGSDWIDNLGVQNADELWATIAKYPRVALLLFGHVHQVYDGEINGVRYLSGPSTSFQFKKDNDEFALANEPQGFRYLELYPEGEIKTKIYRLEDYVGHFSVDAKGY